MKTKRRTWTMAERKYIADNLHLTDKQLADHFWVTERALYDFRTRQKLTKADKVPIGFQKGMIPHNKGKKQSDYMDMEKVRKAIEARTRPEGTPYRLKPDGNILIDVNGRNRLSYAKYVWEQAHGVTLHRTTGMIHLDGDKTNCDLSNLKPETYHERLTRKKQEQGIKVGRKRKEDRKAVRMETPYQFYAPFKQAS